MAAAADRVKAIVPRTSSTLFRAQLALSHLLCVCSYYNTDGTLSDGHVRTTVVDYNIYTYTIYTYVTCV